MWNYFGELDDNGLACGEGVANNENGDSWSGTFVNGCPEGILVKSNGDCRLEGEFRAGNVFGKHTQYFLK